MSESENPPRWMCRLPWRRFYLYRRDPVASSQLAEALGISVSAVEQGLKQLDGELQTRGLRLPAPCRAGAIDHCSGMAETVERFLGLEATSRLRPGGTGDPGNCGVTSSQ